MDGYDPMLSMLPAIGGFRTPDELLGAVDDLFTGPSTSVGGWIQPLIGLGSQIISALQGPPPTFPAPMPSPAIPYPQAEQPMLAQVPQVLARSFPANCATTAGMAGLNCVVNPRTGKLIKKSSRRRIKLVPDGSGGLMPIICCGPRRMNPLNPKALGRASRRLGSFQRIAAHVEKQIQKACKPRRGTRRAPRTYSHGHGCQCRSCA